MITNQSYLGERLWKEETINLPTILAKTVPISFIFSSNLYYLQDVGHSTDARTMKEEYLIGEIVEVRFSKNKIAETHSSKNRTPSAVADMRNVPEWRLCAQLKSSCLERKCTASNPAKDETHKSFHDDVLTDKVQGNNIARLHAAKELYFSSIRGVFVVFKADLCYEIVKRNF